MKILFLTDPDPEYGGTLLYSGLVEAIGVDNIIDYPYKASHHGGTDTYPNKHAGHEGEFCQCWGFEWTIPYPAIEYSLEQIKDLLRSNAFDAVICESIREEVLKSLDLLKDLLPKKRIMLDDEDSDKVYHDLIEKYKLKLYLKRELTLLNNTVKNSIIKPYPFSTILTQQNTNIDRDIDVLCAFGGKSSHPMRLRVGRIIDSMRDNFVFDKKAMADSGFKYLWEDYKERLYRSKVVIAPRGAGQDTLRRWEAPSAGALVFMEKLTLIEEFPLIDGEHCVMYTHNCSDFEQNLRSILNNDEKRERIALNGRKYVFEHHTPKARAIKLMEWISEL